MFGCLKRVGLMSLSPDYFNTLSAALEIKSRTRSVNDKITYAAEVRGL